MKIKLLAIVICIVFLTGCWDRRELNDLGIVEAFGFDKDTATGEIILTCQIIRPGALKKEGGGEKSPVELIVTRGKTVYEAVRNISMQFDRRAFFAHNKVIVISEQLAREGVLSLGDLLARNNEMRPLAWLIIAKDTKAADILGVEHGIEEVQAAFLEGIIRKGAVNSKVSVVNVQQFVKGISSEEINPIAGVMEIIEQPVFPAEKREKQEEGVTRGVKLSGTAVFKKDKLAGYLGDLETLGLNWITGKVESGIINVPSTEKKDKLISIVLQGAQAKIKPELKDGNISFIIEVKAEGNIGEQQNSIDVSDLEVFEKIENELEIEIEKEIKGTVEKVQKELRTDIFGFGNAFYKKYPKEWNKIKDKWQVLFPDIQYKIKVDARLKSAGLLLKPIKSGG